MEPLQKYERYTLSKIVSEQLKQYIIDQKLKPGDRLPSEREMVSQMGISRSVIREALRYLEISGIVSIQHGEGTFVQEQDLTPLMEQLAFQWRNGGSANTELHELRLMLELNAVELALRNGNHEDWDEMEQIVLQISAEPEEADSQLGLSIRFHQALLHATHQKVFIQMAEPLVIICSNLDLPARNTDKTRGSKGIFHLQFIEAMRGRQEAQAKAALRALLKRE